MRIEFADSDSLATLPDELVSSFMEESLGLDYAETFVSDESMLSDFAGCGAPEELMDATNSYDEYLDAWDKWMLEHLKSKYGLEYSSTRINMVVLLSDINKAKNPTLH